MSIQNVSGNERLCYFPTVFSQHLVCQPMSVSSLHGICMSCHFLDTVNPLPACLYDLPKALQLLRPRTMKTRTAETELDLEQMSACAKSHN